MKILVLEPYFGGSHRAFLQGLMQQLPYAFDLHALPARKWKWRMRLSAPYFAEKLHRMEPPDRILCSTFVDVAALRGLGPAWIREVPVLTYFHENQFVYPVQVDDQRDFHFALTNLTTALASDRLAFNSSYNLESFLAGANDLLRKTPDMPGAKDGRYEEIIRSRSIVLPPGHDFADIDSRPANIPGSAPVIVWNHRWEHDKNPEMFFEAMTELKRIGVGFSLIVLGQSFERRPEVFAWAEKTLADRIIHFGYAESRNDYIDLLKQGDLVVSTAGHEFYGIAVLEAVRAGCRPLLPKRLSYPELFAEEFLYQDKDFLVRLQELLNDGGRLPDDKARALTERFSWNELAECYQRWFD